MPAIYIHFTTDRFYEEANAFVRNLDEHSDKAEWDEYHKMQIAANRAARQAVAKSLRALADVMATGIYIGSFALPLLDTSNWTEEQCLAVIKDHPRYQGVEHFDFDLLTDESRLELLRIRASYCGPDCLDGDVDEV